MVTSEELKDVEIACRDVKGAKIPFQAYQTHLDQHITFLQTDTESDSSNNSVAAKSPYQIRRIGRGEGSEYEVSTSLPHPYGQDHLPISDSIGPAPAIDEQETPSESELINLNSEVTEQTLIDAASFTTQHYYMMLRG
ncbi:hypothetical protein JQC92_07190 [Shewanella sp. 202IG2-18]|uniref:hypothetical protein n=1 Tax=Parashewanella hymeniacidonis TaxID=2807618 RepID=UPI00195FA8FA|nr:hypothetical protein [Parashewanella hymeniacidonis]MBM7071826.1 hypothetical protein [Parashewanella hymeniacidonis]